ncbi:MAG TPA: ABC transporter permease [Pirellulales bacterium]|nr:ABC transporter permease [Pirellulales bacterium]
MVLAALGPLLGLAAVIAFFAVADYWQGGASFLTLRNLHATSVQASTVAVAALGMTVIIISGGIDLSAGTALALSATVLAHCLKAGYSPAIAVLASVGTGCLAGFLNGVLISSQRLIPFIVTLGSMTAYLGVAKFIARETTVRPLPKQVPDWLSSDGLVTTRPQPAWIIEGLLPNFASGVWLALALAVLLAVLLRYTVFGRYVFAVGSNEATARLCGINVPLMKTSIYALSGLFVGIAGLYQFARLSVGNPVSGSGLELRVIAAVVIGGGSLNGGRGSVLGTLSGAAMMAAIASGCNQLGLRNPTQDIIIGVIIVAAVALDQWRQRSLAG